MLYLQVREEMLAERSKKLEEHHEKLGAIIAQLQIEKAKQVSLPSFLNNRVEVYDLWHGATRSITKTPKRDASPLQGSPSLFQGLPKGTAFVHLAPVVQKIDRVSHWINLYPVDNTIGFVNAYPLHSDLSNF